jgi:hypothetical protein
MRSRFLVRFFLVDGTFEALLIDFHDWTEVNLLPIAILVLLVVSRYINCWRLKQNYATRIIIRLDPTPSFVYHFLAHDIDKYYSIGLFFRGGEKTS